MENIKNFNSCFSLNPILYSYFRYEIFQGYPLDIPVLWLFQKCMIIKKRIFEKNVTLLWPTCLGAFFSHNFSKIVYYQRNSIEANNGKKLEWIQILKKPKDFGLWLWNSINFSTNFFFKYSSIGVLSIIKLLFWNTFWGCCHNFLYLICRRKIVTIQVHVQYWKWRVIRRSQIRRLWWMHIVIRLGVSEHRNHFSSWKLSAVLDNYRTREK